MAIVGAFGGTGGALAHAVEKIIKAAEVWRIRGRMFEISVQSSS
jgi:hypothetical protein